MDQGDFDQFPVRLCSKPSSCCTTDNPLAVSKHLRGENRDVLRTAKSTLLNGGWVTLLLVQWCVYLCKTTAQSDWGRPDDLRNCWNQPGLLPASGMQKTADTTGASHEERCCLLATC